MTHPPDHQSDAAKPLPSRLTHNYERGLTAFGVVVVVLLVLAGLTVAGAALVFAIGLAQWGNNK